MVETLYCCVLCPQKAGWALACGAAPVSPCSSSVTYEPSFWSPCWLIFSPDSGFR